MSVVPLDAQMVDSVEVEYLVNDSDGSHGGFGNEDRENQDSLSTIAIENLRLKEELAALKKRMAKTLHRGVVRIGAAFNTDAPTEGSWSWRDEAPNCAASRNWG